MTFHWSMRNAWLLTPPLVSPSRQQYVQVSVKVLEETKPVYALVVSVQHETRWIERRITKSMMTQVMERVFATPCGYVASLPTRVLDGMTVDEAVDNAMRKWICGETRTPPTREQLIQWLLSRILVAQSTTSSNDEWRLVLCGEEKEMEKREKEEMSPLPPPYSAGSHRSERVSSDHSDGSIYMNEMTEGDNAAAPDEDQRDNEKQTHGEHTAQRASAQQRMLSTHLKDEDTDGLLMPSRYRFEPAKERMDRQRRHSLSSTSSNAWTEERHHFQLELSQSKRDIEIAMERQCKAEAIASLRRKLTVEQSHKKLLAHEQKRWDARMVKQSIADTLEYHDIAYRMESQLKQTKIASTRDQEKLAQSMRIALGHSGDRWQKGPVIGKGPLSQIEIDLLVKGDRKSSESSMWVYDLHGRRHHEREAGTVAAENVFESAMKKIQRLLERKPTENIDLFRKYDLDHNGTLEYGEFKRLLLENGVELSHEQAKTLFRHFDPNQSGAIDYGELLWGFFNRRAFLKRWRQRKTKLSPREIKQMLFKYDRVGRGALSPIDFQLALDDIGFRVTESEAKLLCLKFDVNNDGFIDYNEFHAFVNDDIDVGDDDMSATSGDAVRNRSQAKKLNPRRRFPDDKSIPSDGGSDVQRILEELKALNKTQESIRRSLAMTL